MIYMESNITLDPSKMATFGDLEKSGAAIAEKLGAKIIGCWLTTIGNVNEYTILTAYDDFTEFQKVSAAMRQSKEYQAYLHGLGGVMVSGTRRIMSPTPSSPLK